MASPFRVFRKNQKAMMVVLTILAMFSFVFIGQWTDLGSSRSSQSTDPEVFTWKYGPVKESDLRNQLSQREIVRQFLFRAGVAAGGPAAAREVEYRIAQFLPNSRRAVVNTMLLQKKAEQMGISVSDAMVNSFLRSWTQDKLNSQQLADVVRGMSSQFGRVSQPQLFDALRAELAAIYVQDMFSPLLTRRGGMLGWEFRGETPADRWDYFCRLKRDVTAEIMPVKVEDFIAEIPDPSPEELRKFYDQWKNDYPYYNQFPWPDLSTPGFNQPARAQFQYLKANFEKLVAEELPKITDEEIKSYYELRKDDFFKKSKLPETPEKPADGADAKPEGQSTLPTEPSKADESGAAGKSDAKSESPTTGGLKAGDAKSSTGKLEGKSGDAKDTKSSGKSDAKSPAGKTADEKSGGGKSDAKSDGQKSGGKADKKSSDGKQSNNAAPASLDGELLAFADDALLLAQKAPATGPKSAPKAEAKADPKATKSEPKSAAPVEGKSKADGDNKSAASSDAKAPDAKSPDSQLPPTQTPESPTSDGARPVEYEPLEKVTETIRKRLAEQNVEDRIKKAFDAVERPVDQYRRSYDIYRAKSQSAKDDKAAPALTPPKAPDLETLAKDSGLELEPKQTELVSARQAYQDYDLGKSRRILTPDDFSGRPFYDYAFQPGVKPYRTNRNDDNDRNQYLWWKTAEEPQRVPPLEEIQPEVLRAWKFIQARKPALAKAEEYAAQARKLKQTLKETFGSTAGLEVRSIGPFTWLTRPLGQFTALPRITEVADVQQGGEEFMKAVFALSTGETGVAQNRPQSEYYVVQIESEKPPLDELREQFMAAMSNQMTALPYAMVSASENSSIVYAWLKELETEFGFQMVPGQTLMEERGAE